MLSEIESETANLGQQKTFEKARRRSKKAIQVSSSQDAKKTGQEQASNGEKRPESGFDMDSEGLWHIGMKYSEKGPIYFPPVWVCAPFKVLYRLRFFNGLGWRLMLRITNRDGVLVDVILADADIGGQDGAWVKTLADAGLKIHPEHRRKLAQYLITECDQVPRARGVEKTGLFDGCYVLTHRTIGTGDEPILYLGEDREKKGFSERGSALDWRNQVGRYAVGNSRMILAICASLAAPLLPLSGIGESGGFHIFGRSGDGKTTLAKVAASGWALPGDYVTTWRNTSNATEGTASRFNHFLLINDEIREAADRDLQVNIMMLGNGKGKGRMRDNATLREPLTWLLLWLSTGEYATTHYLEQAGIKADPGMAVRQVDIPSNGGKGWGVFEHLHDMPTSKALAEHLREACDQYHGAVGIAWLEYITTNMETIRRELPDHVRAMETAIAKHHANAESQVKRVIRRFALLAITGELATKVGLTGWSEGDAVVGVRRCLDAWLAHRGGTENLEERRILERLRDFLGRNLQGRFIPWDRANDERAPAKSETVGYRKDGSSINNEDGSATVIQTVFYITPEGWAEIFKGMDPAEAAEVLLKKGVLVPGKWNRKGQTEERPYRREYLPGMGRRQCYKTVDNVFDLLGDVESVEGDRA